jgi:uncharacterized metal-binding protein YceD (DUF177 family)
MKKMVIDIYRMHNKLHHFDFKIDDEFFKDLDQDLVESGKLLAKIELDKNDAFIQMNLNIEGSVLLTCDRSLDLFDYPIEENRQIIFKYGDQEMELDHQMVMITNETQRIDVGQYVFEFIGLAVPLKRLHPRYEQEQEEYGTVVYSSESEMHEHNQQESDPRWGALKKLKKN